MIMAPSGHLVVFGVQVRCIIIAERDNLRIGMGKEGLEKLAAAVAHPDETKTDLVACAEHPGRGQRRSSTGGRGRHRGLREITTVETRGHDSCLSPAPASRPCVMETFDGSRRTWFRPDALIREWSPAGVNGPMTTGETQPGGTMEISEQKETGHEIYFGAWSDRAIGYCVFDGGRDRTASESSRSARGDARTYRLQGRALVPSRPAAGHVQVPGLRCSQGSVHDGR